MVAPLFTNKAVKELIDHYKRTWSISHGLRLMGWDLEVYMPEKGAQARSEASSQLELMLQHEILALKKLTKEAARAKDLNAYEQGVVRCNQRDLDYFTKIPPKLIEKMAKATSNGFIAWRTAREKSEFRIFRPLLEEIVHLNREKADRLGYKGHPYNALLDMYEEGFTVNAADRMFGNMIPQIKKITEKILAEGRFPQVHPLEKIRYREGDVRKVNEYLLKVLDMPGDRFRMDLSAHPFTMEVSSNDVRITTRYEGIDFKTSLYSTIHESGHAIYALNYDQRLEMTPAGGGVSLGIHESQSRLWENIIGRSRQFTDLIYPNITRNLSFTQKYSRDSMYNYFNSVKPSLIRVEADEVTYNFHVYLRYEIEKKLMSGKISVSELPQYWNDMMEEYVGVRPKKDSQGVLQDVHWAHGSIGYFPTYVVGNVVGALSVAAMEKSMSKTVFWNHVRKGQFKPIKSWLEQKIQRWCGVYPPEELQKRVFGTSYDPGAFVSYLEEKYLG